jgi:hypothetical protein
MTQMTRSVTLLVPAVAKLHGVEGSFRTTADYADDADGTHCQAGAAQANEGSRSHPSSRTSVSRRCQTVAAKVTLGLLAHAARHTPGTGCFSLLM